MNITKNSPGILFITSYPPRVCGIATYSQDLIKALGNKFNSSFTSFICALESKKEMHTYPKEVQFVLDTSNPDSFVRTASEINRSEDIQIVMIQHEFGLFDPTKEDDFLQFLESINKPVIITFHTVLPRPDLAFKLKVERIMESCDSVVVMTETSAEILRRDYRIVSDNLIVIPHGVHLVPHFKKELLKEKYGVFNCTVLSTFGLIGRGKSIETSLDALPGIIKEKPEVIFLVIGKTHPGIIEREGEVYREMLEQKVRELQLEENVRFINEFLPLDELLEYLQLTDIYLFTSSDPNQAVSGTFSYAISCGCPIISTPIPHAKEVLRNDAGILFDFKNSVQLSEAVILLLNNEQLRTDFSNTGLQRIAPSAWQNVAIAYAELFKKLSGADFQFNIPPVNLEHFKRLTDKIGMIQFCKIDQPDISSGYTLDDNARALIALLMHFDKTGDQEDLIDIEKYLHFIKYCQQAKGNFLNYVDEKQNFTTQNYETNLEDSNGRAIWALGFLLSHKNNLPSRLGEIADDLFKRSLNQIEGMHSTRAMAFSLKGLYYYHKEKIENTDFRLVVVLAERLVQMYKHEGELAWEWFESYLTYGNSILPEALLCAYQLTGNMIYKEIAQSSFAFLLSQTFGEDGIKVITNGHWLQKGQSASEFGEQPIDVAYTIMALHRFYQVCQQEKYLTKIELAFSWFLGKNHLKQIIYNPGTGGCYDGLEQYQVNLNQGAESTVSYLMARLTVDEHFERRQTPYDLMMKSQIA